MRTRGLKVEFDPDGALRTSKFKDPNESEKKKIRKVYGTKIAEALLKSLPELSISKGDTYSEKYVKRISDKICDTCYDEYSDCNRTFKRKIFEICSNIKRDTNSELREKILTRKMSISELVRADTLELAPEDVREKRRLEVEKHYIRNVILKPQEGLEDSDQQDRYEGSTDTNSSHTPGKINEDNSENFDPKSKTKSSNSDLTKEESTIEDLKQFFSKSSFGDKEQGTEQGDSTESNDEMLSFGRSNKKVLSDNEDFTQFNQPTSSTEPPNSKIEVKLSDPPNCDHYTFESVRSRISQRMESIPSFVSKPFLDPFNTAVRRLEMLMTRSSILSKSHKNLGI